MRYITALLVLCWTLAAGQSWVPGANQYLSRNWQQATWSAFRVEFRIHNFPLATGVTQAILAGEAPAERCEIKANEPKLRCGSWRDSAFSDIDITGRSDIVVRYQRDPSANLHMIEIWNADGSGYASTNVELHESVDPWTETANVNYLCAYGAAYYFRGGIAWLRIYTTPATAGALPNPGGRGDFLSLEFEGNLKDSSGRNWNYILSSGSASYVSSPDYPPTAHAGADVTARAGAVLTLNGSGFSAEGSSLTYVWQQVRGPSSAIMANRSVASPSVSGLVAGEYEFRLTVTDPAGRQASDTVAAGVVAADDEGRVLIPDERVATLFGPMLMLGRSPWPWFDDRHRYLADAFGGWLSSDPNRIDDWNAPLSGTISVTQGSTVITGANTQFQTDFCAGGTAPVSETPLIVWYPIEGGTGRYEVMPKSCDSQTQITLQSAYQRPTASGLRYAKMACRGCWVNGSDNVNYYDNVLAFYALYYRTGLTKYRDYARTLADRWWSSPRIDEGRCREANACIGWPRGRSLAGMVARALDGRPDMWPGLRRFIDASAVSIQTTSAPYDIRENAYEVAEVAYGALFDPDSGRRAQYIVALQNSIVNKWAPNQKPNGNWTNFSYGYSNWNGHPGTANLTNGSNVVTGTGTNWSSSIFPSPAWFPPDETWYTATWVSPAEVRLDRPYEGTTRSGSAWQFFFLVGYGTQPFQMGIVGTAWHYAYRALEKAGSPHATLARKFVLDAASWIRDYGYSPVSKGLYYARVFYNCEPISDSTPGCGTGGQGDEDSRFLNSEVMNAFTAAYLLSGDSSYKEQADKMFGAMWGKLGGPESDGVYLSTYNDNGWTLVVKKSKDFGFAFGYGFGAGWPAGRLGPAAEAAGQEVSTSAGLGGVANAVQVRVTLMRPDGSLVQRTCTELPCTVAADQRQGDHLMRIEYLSASGSVLSASDWMPAAVK